MFLSTDGSASKRENKIHYLMLAHIKYLPHVLLLAGGLALAGCGGSSTTPGTGGGGGGGDPTAVSLSSVTTTDDGYVAPSAGTYPIAAGGTTTQGSVMFSCASGSEACSVVVAANGDITSTGGTVTAANSAAFKLAMDNAKTAEAEAGAKTAQALFTAIGRSDNDTDTDNGVNGFTIVNEITSARVR